MSGIQDHPGGESLQIEAVGDRGDGIARRNGAICPVPFALPGEIVRAHMERDRAEIAAIEKASPDRVAPVCPHFGVCGGCALQHWSDSPLAAWKADLVVRALARQGLEADIASAIPAWGAGRRRAAFHARRVGGVVAFGFAEARSNRLADIAGCPVLTPGLQAALPRLRTLAEALAPKDGVLTLSVTETLTGLDVDATGGPRVAAQERRGLERLSALAEDGDLARLTLHGEPAVMRRTPLVRIGPASVRPPPAAFLQATEAGEAALAARALEWTKGAKTVADLFSGLGTFALRLKAQSQVRSFEADADAVAAQKAAADALAGGRSVTVTARDLFRAPLAPLELKGVDAIVLDPPRAGAEAQCRQIARTKIARVVMISCDPSSFARDARALVDGGYRLEAVEAFDQFRYSPHVEIAARFSR